MNHSLPSLRASAFVAAWLPLVAASAQPPQKQRNGTNPVVAPDGRHIAFISDRSGSDELYVMSPNGGSITQLTFDSRPVAIAGWLDGGSRLAYAISQRDSMILFAVAAEGGTGTRMGAVRAANARVSPDGQTVAYGTLPWQTMPLFIAHLDGSSARQITPGTGAFYCNAFSPDGKSIASSRSDSGTMQVWIFSLDGSAMRKITAFTAEEGNPQCPSWTQDGSRLAVQSDVFDRANPARSSSHIWVIDIRSSQAHKLAPHSTPFLDELPSWFPDGSRIAFQSNRTGRWEVWAMNADGTNPVQLTR